jgi:ATPase family protein associated with various cellular activities (AAA)
MVGIPAPSRSLPTRGHFHAKLERLRLRALLAVDRLRPSGAADRLHADLATVEADLAAAAESTRDRVLARRFQLDPDELELLWFAVGMTVDGLLAPHALVLAGSDARRGASLAAFAAVAGLDADRARSLGARLDPQHPLLRAGLLVPAEPTPITPLTPFTAARRLVGYLAGQDALAPGLAAVAIPEAPVLDSLQQDAARRIAQALAAPDPLILVVDGKGGVGRRTLVALAARELGAVAVAVDLRRLPPTAAALQEALVALRQEQVLAGVVPVVGGAEDLAGADGDAPARRRLLARELEACERGAVLITTDPGLELEVGRQVVRVSVPVPGAATRRALWTQALGEQARALAPALDEVAERFRLGAGGIRRAAAAAAVVARTRDLGHRLQARDLVDGVRADIRERLGGLARRIDVTQRWSDLVLDADVRAEIDEIVSRARHAYRVHETWGFRQRAAAGGLAVLFSGPPGTGKTMVAGLMARELDLDVYQIDLSQVVSKWIGETEKNLGQVFDAADAGHALLLFDEADALFAKRTEVRGANDRHANLEVNYLLTRIEAFGGVAVLTTNMDASIDPALRRRLAAHVPFARPSAAEREALWRAMLPAAAPLAGAIDFAALARELPDMAGGHIRNAVLRAAFLAAGSPDGAITHERLRRAAVAEYRAMGRVVQDLPGGDQR